jgi:hypothetical protein
LWEFALYINLIRELLITGAVGAIFIIPLAFIPEQGDGRMVELLHAQTVCEVNFSIQHVIGFVTSDLVILYVAVATIASFVGYFRRYKVAESDGLLIGSTTTLLLWIVTELLFLDYISWSVIGLTYPLVISNSVIEINSIMSITGYWSELPNEIKEMNNTNVIFLSLISLVLVIMVAFS